MDNTMKILLKWERYFKYMSIALAVIGALVSSYLFGYKRGEEYAYQEVINYLSSKSSSPASSSSL